MSKKKFINKKKGATIKLVDRPLDHVDTNEENQNIKIFQVVQAEQRNLADIIEKKLNDQDYKNYPTKPVLIKSSDDALSLVRGRDDLWINQINKKKQEEEKLTQAQLNPHIKMKQYDENGMVVNDGYDYSQHVVKKVEGELLCKVDIQEDERPQVTMDIDYDPEEMTAEQKEVFEALQYEGDEAIYDELEDDFVLIANDGEECFIQPKKAQQDEKAAQEKEKVQEEDQIEIEIEEEYDEEDDWQDEEEEEIPMTKARKEEKKEKEQFEDEEDEEDDEDIEIDSDMEKQFEEEMKNFDKPGKKQVKFSEQQLSEILDDHLKAKGMKKPQGRVQDDEDEEKREKELLKLKSKNYLDYLKAKFPNTDPKEFHLRKEIPELTLEEDVALQNYIQNMDKEDEEEVDDERDTVTVEDNILQRTLQMSQMSRVTDVNVVRYETKNKKKKQEEKDQIQEKEEEAEEGQKIRMKDLVRKSGENAEEKKQRKELVKQLKQMKKDKKKAFKEALKSQSKNHSLHVKVNHDNNNAGGIMKVY